VDEAISSVPIVALVLDASSMTNIDASGISVLDNLIQASRRQDPPTSVLLSGAKGDFRLKLAKSGMLVPLT
jgi:anti-anti-sigma regulatory factor